MFHPEQIESATNIHKEFLKKKLRYAILYAQCQSGKTGAYHKLIYLMMRNGDIQRVYILCGSNETNLYEQAHKDTMKYNLEYYNNKMIQVIFRQDFDKHTMDIKNALIIVDESHLDQGKDQQLNKFLTRHCISGLDGNPLTLIKNNTFIVSVDATPYSELASLKHGETPYEKYIEQLKPGEGYFGLADYLYNGLMKPTFDIASKSFDFVNLLKKFKNKYMLMRLPNGKNAKSQEQTIKELCEEYGYKLYYHTSDKNKEQIEIEDLKKEPNVNTIVIIRGRLRAGKVVHKKHIGFVWEGAKNSKTDSLVQGLPGRMCGYEFGETKPLIFVPESSIKDFEGKIVKASEMTRSTMVPYLIPMKATNIKKSCIASASVDGKTQCVPLKIHININEYNSIFEDTHLEQRSKRQTLREILLENINLIQNNIYYSNEQKEEILAFVSHATPHIRNCKQDSCSSQLSYFKSIYEAYKNNCASSKHVSYDGPNPEMTFLISYPGFEGLNEPGTNQRDIYVIFYTIASNANIETKPIESRIPHTNGKSIFSFQNNDLDSPPVAAGLARLTSDDIKLPESFKKYMNEYLTRWKDGILNLTPSIQTNKDAFRFSKSEFNWISKHNSDVEKICEELSLKFNINIKIIYSQGRSLEGFFNLKELSW